MKHLINLSMKLMVCLMPLLLCAKAYSTRLPLDSTDKYVSILKVDHFNSGDIKDTLVGTALRNGKFLPRFILWGRPEVNGIPDSIKHTYTKINYPEWMNFRCSANLYQINKDKDCDIVIEYHKNKKILPEYFDLSIFHSTL